MVAYVEEDGCFSFRIKPVTMSNIVLLLSRGRSALEVVGFTVDDLLMTVAAWKIGRVMDTVEVKPPMHGINVAVDIELLTREGLWEVIHPGESLEAYAHLENIYSKRIVAALAKEQSEAQKRAADELLRQQKAAAAAAQRKAKLKKKFVEGLKKARDQELERRKQRRKMQMRQILDALNEERARRAAQEAERLEQQRMEVEAFSKQRARNLIALATRERIEALRERRRKLEERRQELIALVGKARRKIRSIRMRREYYTRQFEAMKEERKEEAQRNAAAAWLREKMAREEERRKLMEEARLQQQAAREEAERKKKEGEQLLRQLALEQAEAARLRAEQAREQERILKEAERIRREAELQEQLLKEKEERERQEALKKALREAEREALEEYRLGLIRFDDELRAAQAEQTEDDRKAMREAERVKLELEDLDYREYKLYASTLLEAELAETEKEAEAETLDSAPPPAPDSQSDEAERFPLVVYEEHLKEEIDEYVEDKVAEMETTRRTQLALIANDSVKDAATIIALSLATAELLRSVYRQVHRAKRGRAQRAWAAQAEEWAKKAGLHGSQFRIECCAPDQPLLLDPLHPQAPRQLMLPL